MPGPLNLHSGERSDFDNLSRPNGLEPNQHFRQMRSNIINIIGVSPDDQDRDPAI